MTHYDEIAEDVRALARRHLERIGGIEDAPTDLERLCATLEIRLVSEPCWIDTSWNGSAIVSEDGVLRLIVVNSLLKPSEWAFTVAHEIGHLVMDHRPPRDRCREELSDVYARELLMPVPRLVRQIRRFGDDIIYLAGVNGVSSSAMRVRLQELGATLARDSIPFCS